MCPACDGCHNRPERMLSKLSDECPKCDECSRWDPKHGNLDLSKLPDRISIRCGGEGEERCTKHNHRRKERIPPIDGGWELMIKRVSKSTLNNGLARLGETLTNQSTIAAVERLGAIFKEEADASGITILQCNKCTRYLLYYHTPKTMEESVRPKKRNCPGGALKHMRTTFENHVIKIRTEEGAPGAAIGSDLGKRLISGEQGGGGKRKTRKRTEGEVEDNNDIGNMSSTCIDGTGEYTDGHCSLDFEALVVTSIVRPQTQEFTWTKEDTIIKIKELNVDQRNDLFKCLEVDHLNILDLNNADLRQAIESNLKDIITAGPIFDADGFGRTREIEFRSEDEDDEMPDIHSHRWSEDYNKYDYMHV